MESCVLADYAETRWGNIMKLRDHLAGEARRSIVNQENFRARAVTAELKRKIEKAHELGHTQRSLLTVSKLLLEEIRWRRQGT